VRCYVWSKMGPTDWSRGSACQFVLCCTVFFFSRGLLLFWFCVNHVVQLARHRTLVGLRSRRYSSGDDDIVPPSRKLWYRYLRLRGLSIPYGNITGSWLTAPPTVRYVRTKRPRAGLRTSHKADIPAVLVPAAMHARAAGASFTTGPCVGRQSAIASKMSM
jgi:hypothetical protein